MARESKRPLIDDTGARTGKDQEYANQISHPTRMSYIPNEIIVDIVLPRLPAKSLLRFRCVCKSWLSLIADKKFRKKHLHMSTIDDDYSLQRVIFESHIDCLRFKMCSLDSIYSDLLVGPITLDHTIFINEPFHRASTMVGSCDGLVCASTDEGIYLWNPTLRECRRLPRFKIDIPHAYEYDFVYGFGYDYSSDDYKVVAVLQPRYLSINNQVNVYTLSSNSWRRIQAIPHRGGRPIGSRGIFSNGALHWVLELPGFTWSIIALDLATETYHDIAHPTCCGDFYDNHGALGVLGGCLCVMMLSDGFYGKKTNVWIMKEYGLVNSWTKLACFPNLIDRDANYYSRTSYTPLFVSKTGEMLVIYKSIIYLYNLKDKTFRSPLIAHSFDSTYSALYVESLVSPGVEDSTERRATRK